MDDGENRDNKGPDHTNWMDNRDGKGNPMGDLQQSVSSSIEVPYIQALKEDRLAVFWHLQTGICHEEKRQEWIPATLPPKVQTKTH